RGRYCRAWNSVSIPGAILLTAECQSGVLADTPRDHSTGHRRIFFKKSRRRTNTVVSRRAFVPNSLEDCDMTVLANYAMLLAQAGSGDSAWSLLQHSSLVFWTAIALICIVPSIAHYWWKVRKAE